MCLHRQGIRFPDDVDFECIRTPGNVFVTDAAGYPRRYNNNNNNNTSNNRGDWNHLKVIQKIREQHTRKTRSQGPTENSHIGHCTHTSESTNVKVQWIPH